jgi:hypothetical protein
MLQWKPKLIALNALLVLVAVVGGQLTWESFGGFSCNQFTWL